MRKRYAQELFFQQCPGCGTEMNMDFVQSKLQEVAREAYGDALTDSKKAIIELRKLQNERFEL